MVRLFYNMCDQPLFTDGKARSDNDCCYNAKRKTALKQLTFLLNCGVILAILITKSMI